jgi:hypothetical protein
MWFVYVLTLVAFLFTNKYGAISHFNYNGKKRVTCIMSYNKASIVYESSCVFMSWVDAFFDSLEAEECFSNNEIRSEPLLNGICFCIFISVPLIYNVFVL